MSKIKIKFLMLFIFFILSCSKNYNDISSKVKSEILDNEAYSKFITLNNSKIVYSDERTLSIKYYSKENKKSLVLDKIDNEQRTNQLLGKHCYFIFDNKEYVFYNDVINEKKQIFKLITKEKEKDDWFVFANNLKLLIDFTFFLYDDKIFLITFGETIQFWFLENNYLKEIEVDFKENFKNRNGINLSCFIKNNNIFLFYILEKELIVDKFILNNENNNFSINFIEETKIYNNIGCYDVTFYNDSDYYACCYDNSTFELKFYNSKDKNTKKIGYFLSIFSLKILNYNDTNYIFYSSIDIKKSKSNLPQYYLSMIYNKNYIWEEFILSYFDFPIFGIDASLNQNQFEVVAGGNSLILFNFDFKK